MEINDCKHCGTSVSLEVFVTEGHYSGLIDAVVGCGDCGMKGPLALADDLDVPDKDFLIALAVKKWNKVNGLL